MKKTFTGLLTMCMILATAGILLAQNAGSATWMLSKADTNTAKVTGNVMADTESVVGMVPAYETPADPPSWWVAGTYLQKVKPDSLTSDYANTQKTHSWPVETTYNPKRYVQFTVGPKSGYNMTVDSLSLWIGAKGYQQFVGVIYYSTNADFSNPQPLASNMDTDTLSEHPAPIDTTFKGIQVGPSFSGLSIAVNNGQKLYIRVYPYAPYGKDSNSKYMYIGNVRVYGSTTKAAPPPPMAGTATWMLSKADTNTAKVTGNVMADTESVVGLVPAYETPSDPPSWWVAGTYLQKVKPDSLTSDYANSQLTHSWPVETTYNPKRYVQFSVGPKSGYDMTVDSLSLWIGAKGYQQFIGAIYYSTNSDFSNPQMLAGNKDTLSEHPAPIDTTFKGIQVGPSFSGLSISVKDGQKLYIRVYPYAPYGKDSNSKYMYIGDVEVYASTQMSTAIQKNETTAPSGFALEQNYPNPFNPTTNITYRIPEKSRVSLKVYNVLGQEVATLVNNRQQAAGNYTVRFDGSKLASGVYIYRLTAGSFTMAKELTLIK